MRLGKDCTKIAYIYVVRKHVPYITFPIFPFIRFSIPFHFPVHVLVKPVNRILTVYYLNLELF